MGSWRAGCAETCTSGSEGGPRRRAEGEPRYRASVRPYTYLPTWEGFLYLAVVLDVFSRKVVGWAMRTDLTARLATDALEMAVFGRRAGGVIHHSDQGVQYTSVAFGARLEAAGAVPSMGSVGDAYDNALCEAFFATLECELIDRETWRTRAEARVAVFEWIEGWYNPQRRHSSIDYLSPVEYERRCEAEHVTP